VQFAAGGGVAADGRIGSACLLQGQFRGQNLHKRIDPRVYFGDAIQMRLHHLHAGDLLALDEISELLGGEFG